VPLLRNVYVFYLYVNSLNIAMKWLPQWPSR